MISPIVVGPARLLRLGRAVAILATLSLFVLLLPGDALAEAKVTICHATDSEGNPYVTNEPDASGDLNGHLGHTGPIWYPGAKADGVTWGDVIPPIPGIIDEGLNWTAEGQAILENGCVVPGQAPTGTLPSTGSEAPAAATGTLPATSTTEPRGRGGSGTALALLLVLLAAGAAGLLIMRPVSNRGRR